MRKLLLSWFVIKTMLYALLPIGLSCDEDDETNTDLHDTTESSTLESQRRAGLEMRLNEGTPTDLSLSETGQELSFEKELSIETLIRVLLSY